MGTETLPGQLRLTPSFPFVGRPREMAALQSLLPQAPGEGRRIALVGGEAGSGKSRLVREFAESAADAGALVLYGACEPDLTVAYRPVADAIDQFVQSSDPADLRRDLGAAGGELTRLVPRLADVVDGLRMPVAADQDTERLRLHQAVADLLVNLGERAPTVLILEDAHWADAPTLALLRHLSRAAAGARLLVIATFRDLAADVPAALSSALVDLRRSEGVVPVRLGGLTAADIEQLITLAGGEGLGDQLGALAAEIHELTEGLPFLVIELWRELLECGAIELGDAGARLRLPVSAVASPEAVREVVSQRLGRLDADTNALLEFAAVIGPEFELTLLAAASGAGHRVLQASLDQADLSGMVSPTGGTPPRYRFAHELVRRALYDRLPAMRRADLHLRVGEALEESGRGSPAELARHFTMGVPLGGTQRAIAYNLAAADAATAALAFDQAAAAYRTVLDLGVADVRERARVQLQLGEASFRAGASEHALDAYEAVFETALEIDDGELAAAAAVGFESACWRMGSPDSEAERMLLEAERRLDPRDSSLRVVVLSGLARAYAFRGDHAAEPRAAHRFAGHGAAAGRPHRAGPSLHAGLLGAGTSSIDEILEMLDESLRLAAELGDIEIEAEAREWRVAALIAKGDLESARHENSAVAEAAARTRQPFVLHVAEHYKATIALCDGRLAEAEAAAERSFEWGSLLTGRDPTGPYGVQMFSIRREQGRLAELAPVVRILARSGEDEASAWAPGLAVIMAELGMTAEARAMLEDLHRDGLDEPALLALDGLAHLSGRRGLPAGRPGDGAAGAARARTPQRRGGRDRPRGCVLRVGRPLSGHAHGDARRHRARRPSLRTRAPGQPADARPHLGGAYGLRVRSPAGANRPRPLAGAAA